MHRLLTVLTPLLLLLYVSPVSAQDKAQEDTELAKRYYKLGEELYRRADFRGAKAQFQLSYKLSKKPALLWNIARCQEPLGEHEAAVASYEGYLKSNPANAALVRTRIANLKKLMAEKQKPKPQPQPQPQPKPQPVDPPSSTRTMRIAGWSLVGVGAAAAVGGLAMGVVAGNKSDDLEAAAAEHQEYADVKDDESLAKGLETGAIVGLAVGGAALAAGAVLLVLDMTGGEGETNTAWLAPAPTASGASVAAGFSF